METPRRPHLGSLGLIAALLLLAVPAWAQGPAGDRPGRRPPPTAPGEGCEATQPAHGPRSPWGKGGPPGGGRRGPEWELGRHLFRLLPEDRRPLAPGEDEELLAFVRQHMPRLADAMERLRERDPERFRTRLVEQAPRLRHLRRIHEMSPRLGEIIKQHADNMLQIHRATRSLRQAAPSAPETDAMEQEVRRQITASVRLEIEALSVLADALEQQQAQRVAERAAAWLANDADLSGESEELRESVAAYRAASSDSARAEAQTVVEQAAAGLVESEIDALRRHARQMEANTTAEVDRRFADMLEGPPSRRR